MCLRKLPIDRLPVPRGRNIAHLAWQGEPGARSQRAAASSPIIRRLAAVGATWRWLARERSPINGRPRLLALANQRSPPSRPAPSGQPSASASNPLAGPSESARVAPDTLTECWAPLGERASRRLCGNGALQLARALNCRAPNCLPRERDPPPRPPISVANCHRNRARAATA